MQDVYYLDVESSKKDSSNKLSKIATTDLIVKKEGKQFKVLDCRMEGGITYGIGNMIRASKMGVIEFMWEAIKSFNSNPNKPTNITLNKSIYELNSWGEEATEDILPDEVLRKLGIDPSTVIREGEV